MQQVYSHAALNVAATAARDSSFGLYCDRDPILLAPFKLDLAWSHNEEARGEGPISFQSYVCHRHFSTTETIDLAPLNRRAWVMQERQLSRCIAHFTREMLYWECHEVFANEIYPQSLPSKEIEVKKRDTRVLKRLLNSPHDTGGTDEQHEALHKAWSSFLSVYTRCRLTCAQDKLVALGGIVQQISQALQDELVAGLWRSRFIEQLCWYTSESSDNGHSRAGSKPWIAPTWSWASCDYPTHRGGTSNLGQRREVVELVELDVQSKPSGALIAGYIKLRCRLVPALIQFKQCDGWRKNWMMFSDRKTSHSFDLKL